MRKLSLILMTLLCLCASMAWGTTITQTTTLSCPISTSNNSSSWSADAQGVVFTMTGSDSNGWATDNGSNCNTIKHNKYATLTWSGNMTDISIEYIKIYGRTSAGTQDGQATMSITYPSGSQNYTYSVGHSDNSNQTITSSNLSNLSSCTSVKISFSHNPVWIEQYYRIFSIEIKYSATLPNYKFQSIATCTANAGTVKTTFSDANDRWNNAGTQASTNKDGAKLSTASADATAYFLATENEGYHFNGWYHVDAQGNIVGGRLTDNDGDGNPLTYSETITSEEMTTAVPLRVFAQFVETLYPEFNVAANLALKVGETHEYVASNFVNTSIDLPTLSSIDKFYCTIEDEEIDEENLCPNGNDIISYNVATHTLTALNAGTAKLVFHQDEDGAIAQGSKIVTVTVTKNTNTISINGTADEYESSLAYADSETLTITSSNSNNPRPAFLVSRTSGDNVTSYANGVISSTYNAGEDVWTVTQAEDYKYLAGSATITATVAALNETCYLVNDGNVYNVKDNVKSFEWSDVVAVTGAINFEANRPTGSTGYIDLYKKTESGDWTKFDNIDGSLSNSYNQFSEEIEATCKGIRFDGNNWVGAKNIRNVKVTRLLFLTPSASSINFGNTLENASLTESFTLDWSCSQNDGNITLVSDDTHFTLSTDNETFSASVTIANASQTTGRSGRTTIYVKYVSAATGDHSGHITIYNKSRKSTVNLSGTTQGKYDLVITGANIPANTLYVGEEMASGISFAFEGSDVTVGTPTEGEGSSHFYYVLTNNTVADDATWPNNEYSNKVVEYDAANNKFVAYNAGTATITFYETGNSSINARDPQAYTVVVSKVAPEFTQKLSSVAVNNNVTLGNFASSTSDGMLSWSLPSNSYASMVNNEIVTHSEGTVTVTVSVATTYMYAAAETNMNLDITAVSGAEWLEKPTPTSGSYYLFNVGANQFIKMNNGFPATTETITDATLFTITGTSATDIAYTKSETTYYLYQSAGTYSENTTSVVSMGESFAWNITSYNTSYYQIHSNHKWGKNWAWESDSHISDTERYITANGGNANCSCSKESKEYNTANGSWIFVTEGEYAAFQAYLTAVELLGDENHLSESLKGDLATAVATKTKGSDNYATWTSSLTTLTARCSTYVANLETPETLYRDKNDNGYYMFYNASNNARLGDDVQAYTASWSGNDLVLTAVPNQIIPAGTVALIFSNTQENFYYAFETATSAISGNAFVHHDPTTYNSMEHTDYILTAIRNTDDNSVIDCYAFCKYVGNNHDELLANRNVLVWSAPAQSAPDLIRIETEDNTATALVPVYEDKTQSKQINDGRIYTILGIPVADMSRPGIYIQNGQKYVVR